MTKLTSTLAVSLVALASGCAENQESLIVLMAPAWEEGCVISGDAGAAALPYGTLDLSFGTPYAMPAILQNNTGEGATVNNSGVDSNEIQLLDADVDLSMAQAPEIIDALRDRNEALVSFNVPLSTNSIGAGDTQGVLLEVIPQQTSAALADEITAAFGAQAKLTVEAEVQFHGTRSGNNIGKVGGIDAREFSFPISVCFGCLQTCAGCPGGVCPVGDFEWAGGVCGNAQDLVVFPAACEAPDQ